MKQYAARLLGLALLALPIAGIVLVVGRTVHALTGVDEPMSVVVGVFAAYLAFTAGPRIWTLGRMWRFRNRHSLHAYWPRMAEARYMASIHRRKLEAVPSRVVDFTTVTTVDRKGMYVVLVELQELGLGELRRFSLTAQTDFTGLLVMTDICRSLSIMGSEGEFLPVDALLDADTHEIVGVGSRTLNQAFLPLS